MGLKRISAPASSPVTLAQAKEHLREDSSDFDAQISAMIEAATDYVDGPNGFLGRALIDQTWDYFLDKFTEIQSTLGGKGYIELPLPPLIAVVGVFYTNSAGSETELPASSYVVDDSTAPARIALPSTGSWPSISNEFKAIRVRFRAGYLDQSSPPVAAVPGTIKQAILLTVGTLYENRETVVVGTVVNKMPWAAEQLLRPHRVYLSMA